MDKLDKEIRVKIAHLLHLYDRDSIYHANVDKYMSGDWGVNLQIDGAGVKLTSKMVQHCINESIDENKVLIQKNKRDIKETKGEILKLLKQ